MPIFEAGKGHPALEQVEAPGMQTASSNDNFCSKMFKLLRKLVRFFVMSCHVVEMGWWRVLDDFFSAPAAGGYRSQSCDETSFLQI